MSADRLREAARALRAKAQAVIDSDSRPERAVEHFVHYYGTSRQEGADPLGIDAAYIATMHPGVGLALADWLDTAATNAETNGWMAGYTEAMRETSAMRIADLILGGTS